MVCAQMVRTRSHLFIFVLLTAAMLHSTGGWARPILIADLGVLADAPFYIGIEKGYFADAKIEVELQHFNSGAQAVAPLSVNQIQVVGGAVSAALFNAFARGWPITIAMARARDIPRYSGNALVVPEDLKTKVTSISDLKGLKVALNAPAASMQYMLAKMLAANHLTLADLNLVYMPWPDMATALATKAIDAGATVEPFTHDFDQRGLAFTLSQSADVLRRPPMEVAVLLYNKDWAAHDPDQARAFSVAYLRGVRDFIDALRGGPKRAEVVSILAKYTTMKDPAVYDQIGWTWMDPNGEVSLDGLRDQENFYSDQGSVTKKVPVEEMVDRSFLDYALSKLGRVD